MYQKSELRLRGSILVLKGTRFLPSIEFMYNPEEVNRQIGWAHGSEAVAGRSTPAYGGGSGTPNNFSFTLQMDADRGLLEQRRQNALVENSDVERWLGGPGAVTNDINNREDLRPYIDALKSLLLPQSSNGSGGFMRGAPRRIYLNLGSAISGEVQFDFIDERLFRFGSTMSVLKAELGIFGHMIEESNVTAESFMRKYTGRTTGLPDSVQNASFLL